MKLISSTKKIQSFPQKKHLEERIFASSEIDGGMRTSINAANLELNQSPNIRNYVVRYGKTTRRPGSTLFSPTKPNSNRVLHFTSFAKNDGTVRLLRFTPTTLHSAGSSSWTVYTSGTPISGGNHDRFTTVVADDRLFFANNGIDYIQEIDTTASTYARLGNAEKWKFITGFGDRIIGANLAGISPDGALIGWTGNRNYGVWDSITDKTAGQQPLPDSSSDLADFISGVFGFDNVLVIFRNRSIWNATLTGAPTQPFRFFSRVPNLGSDSPYTICSIPEGIAFLDYRTKNVYVYHLDGRIEPIGDPVQQSIVSQISDPLKAFADYNQEDKEYTLCLVSNISAVVVCWTYNFDNKTWQYSERTNLTSLSDLDYSAGSLNIDELTGSIDALVGTIDSLSPSTTAVTRMFGYSTGELAYEDSDADDDWGTAFTSDLESKVLTIPDHSTSICSLRFEYTPLTPTGSYIIQYRKNPNTAWTDLKTVSWTASDLGINKLVYKYKPIEARRFQWNIRSTSGRFDVNEYEVKVIDEGEPKR